MMIGTLLFGALGGCMGLGAMLPFGQDATDFATVDTNGDAAVTAKELTAWGRDEGVFASLGGDEGVVDPIDLADGLFPLWNVEGSGITEAEWKQGLSVWFPDADAGSFAEWDFDQDGSLDVEELRAGFAHTDLASAWDRDGDGEISEKEAYRAIYRVFDENGDDSLSKSEWNAGIDGWGWDL